MLPLTICIQLKDYQMMYKVWRQPRTWDSCHFYRIIQLFNDENDTVGLKKFLYPIDKYVTLFFEPSVLHAL